jgi:hypothetical protein
MELKSHKLSCGKSETIDNILKKEKTMETEKSQWLPGAWV